MGDIKAKDLNTAGSVAAGDKILGSSINGTTANVTVETIENHAIDTKTYTSLSNATVSATILNILNTLSVDHVSATALGKPVHFYKVANIVIITSPTDMHQAVNAGETSFSIIPSGWQPNESAYGFFGNTMPESKYRVRATGSNLVFYTPSAIDSNAHNCAFQIIYAV